MSVSKRERRMCVQAHLSSLPHRSTWFGRLSQLRKGVREEQQPIPERETVGFFKAKGKERMSGSTVPSLCGMPQCGCPGADIRPGSLNPFGLEAVGHPIPLGLSSAATLRMWRPEALPQKTMICLSPLRVPQDSKGAVRLTCNQS